MNQNMEKIRNAAINVLKPSKKELEHGLELHEKSLVFDAYGFSPTAPIDYSVLIKSFEDGISSSEYRDLREDMTMTRHLFNNGMQKEYRLAWETSGVTCVFQNAGKETNDPAQLLKRHARFTFATDKLKDFVSRAAFPEDIAKVKKENRHCLYFSANSVPLSNASSVEEKLEFIKIFFQLGTRMMHITYNRRNLLGDGCVEKANAGLSDFGRTVVKELNKTGIIPDIAHSGWQTCLDTVKASSRPVVVSHSSCWELNRHCRAKPDEVIKAVADSGGYIGICCIPEFLGGSGCTDALLDHIEYAVKKFGPEHVAIGTDKAYAITSGRKASPRPDLKANFRHNWEDFWPSGYSQAIPEWNKKEQRMSLDWINWPMFTVGMVQRGFSDNIIRKVLGENVMRVATETLKNKDEN